jgi:hypothetical protein
MGKFCHPCHQRLLRFGSEPGLEKVEKPLRVDTGTSTLANFSRPPPIVTRTNNRNSSNGTHIEKIAVNADEQGAISGDRRAQHRNVGWVPAQVGWQIGGHQHDAGASQKRSNLNRFMFWKVEFVEELSTNLFEDKFRYHQFVVQQNVVEQLGAHTGATYMRCNQCRGIERDPHLRLERLEDVFIRIDAAGLGARNQFGAKRSKLSHPQVAPQRLAREVALGNAESRTLALKSLTQFIGDTKRQSTHVLQCTTGYRGLPVRHSICAAGGGLLFEGMPSRVLQKILCIQKVARESRILFAAPIT